MGGPLLVGKSGALISPSLAAEREQSGSKSQMSGAGFKKSSGVRDCQNGNGAVSRSPVSGAECCAGNFAAPLCLHALTKCSVSNQHN